MNTICKQVCMERDLETANRKTVVKVGIWQLALLIAIMFFAATQGMAQIHPEGIISYWKFEEGSGSTAYDSVDGSVSHGTLHNGPRWTTGIVGGAISFDGMDDYVEGPRTQIESGTYPTIGTVEAWVKLNSYPTTYRYGIVAGLTGPLDHLYGQYTCSFSEILEVDLNKKASYYHWDGSGVRRPIGTTTLNLNQWYHLAATVTANEDGSQEVKLYVNGELEGSTMSYGYPAPGKYFDLSFANNCWGYHYSHKEFHGTIDEVAIYDRALTLQEIQQHYQNGLIGLGYEETAANHPPVLDSIGNKTGNEGELLEFTVTAIDPDPGDVLTFGANNLPEGATFNSATATFSWTPGYDHAWDYHDILFSVTDNGTPAESDSESITISVNDVAMAEATQNVTDDLQNIVENSPGTPLADKVGDARAKADTALAELGKTTPDNQAAVGNIEGAAGDLEAAVEDGLLDSTQGTQLMDQLAGIARHLAVVAIQQAEDQGGDQQKINEAEQALNEGDALRQAEEFKDAVNKYKDALAKAESALP